MSKALRITIGVCAAMLSALIAEAVGLKSPWVAYATALFIWTIWTDKEPQR